MVEGHVAPQPLARVQLTGLIGKQTSWLFFYHHPTPPTNPDPLTLRAIGWQLWQFHLQRFRWGRPFPLFYTVWLADWPLICEQQRAQWPSGPHLFPLVLSPHCSLLCLCLQALGATSVYARRVLKALQPSVPAGPDDPVHTRGQTLTLRSAGTLWHPTRGSGFSFSVPQQRRREALYFIMEQKDWRRSMSEQHRRLSLFQWFLIL